MRLVEVYPCVPNLKFLASPVPNFKIRLLGPDHAPFGVGYVVIREFGLPLPGSIRIPNLKYLASPIPKIRRMCHMQWLDVRGGAQTSACISVVFYRTPTKSGTNIVEWSMLNANILDFRYIFAL